jgi:hypothetical protein
MPVADNYAGAAGAAIYCGMDAPTVPVVSPAWLASKAPLEWFPIANTAGYGGAAINPWGGWVEVPDGELLIPASGGHNDSYDNRVVSIDLHADVPTWTVRVPASAFNDCVRNLPYCLDGKPASRHNYAQAHWSTVRNRVMLLGCAGAWGDGYSLTTVDGFDPVTNTWDPPGTYPDIVPGYYGVAMDADGNAWSFSTPSNGTRKFNITTNTWSNPGTVTPTGWVRDPWVLNPSDDTLFGLCWMDNRSQTSAPTAVNAIRFNVATNTMTQITFNASAALSRFISDATDGGTMTYDSINNRFLWYSGKPPSAGVVFVITPNSGNVWDMSLLTFGAGSTPPGNSVNAGINCRFTFIPSLGAVVCAPGSASNMYAFKVA